MKYLIYLSDDDIADIKKWMYEHLEHGSVAEHLYQKIVSPEKYDMQVPLI